MAKKVHLYSCRIGAGSPVGQSYIIGKLDEDLDVLATYTLVENASGSLHCTCPAYKPWCRHMDMLRKFQAEEHIGDGYLYNFDGKAWIPPVTGELDG